MGLKVYKAWRWPRNWQPKGYRQFWFRLVIFSLLGHLIFLFLGFFYHGRDNIKLTVFSQKRLVEVVVVPFYKKIVNTQKMLNAAPKSESQKTKVVQKKITPKAVEKKIEPKKAKLPVIKKEIVKEVSKSKLAPKKNDLKLPEQVIKTKSPISEQKSEPIKPETKPKVIKSELTSELNEPVYIGRHDLKNLQISQELEAVIIKNWQPPLGFDPDIECIVELTVDQLGKVTNFVIKKSSNIMVYDMSVKRIFAKIVMPKAVHNKTLTIVFKQ